MMIKYTAEIDSIDESDFSFVIRYNKGMTKGYGVIRHESLPPNKNCRINF